MNVVKYTNILSSKCLAHIAIFCFYASYWANLKLWFKQKISKEEFDIEARRLLAQENG